MEQEKEEIIITKNSTMQDILHALNAGVTIEQMSLQSGVEKRTLSDKIYRAGIEQDKEGKYIAISESALGKPLSSKIYNVRNKGEKKEGSKEQRTNNNLEQLNSYIRKFMMADREKAKQYTPAKELWKQVKLLQKYLFNVQQDWLIDALISTALNSIEFPKK
jgi:hypothetical protein